MKIDRRIGDIWRLAERKKPAQAPCTEAFHLHALPDNVSAQWNSLWPTGISEPSMSSGTGPRPQTAMEWLRRYNTARPNTTIGGISRYKKLAQASQGLLLRVVKNRGLPEGA